MVALIFEVAGQRYGLDVKEILEVLPAVPLRRLPRLPEYVLGVFRYRGAMVPVIDLCRLIGGTPASALMSTRLILVRHPGPSGIGRTLGLLAERATSIDEASAEPGSSGFAAKEAPFLGGLNTDGDGAVIQYVNVQHLLSDELRERLFAEE